jgi:hypothetical protein
VKFTARRAIEPHRNAFEEFCWGPTYPRLTPWTIIDAQRAWNAVRHQVLVLGVREVPPQRHD